jgi:thiol-disulfide isomerase/thioredoxin
MLSAPLAGGRTLGTLHWFAPHGVARQLHISGRATAGARQTLGGSLAARAHDSGSSRQRVSPITVTGPTEDETAAEFDSTKITQGVLPSMKTLTLLLCCFAATLAIAQTMTYSPEEWEFYLQLNNSKGRAVVSSSLPYCRAVVDSIDQFLGKYPRSIYKSPLLTHKLELTVIFSSDTVLINRLCDSVLAYDSAASTKLLAAEILLPRKGLRMRGASLIREALPDLKQAYDFYRAYLHLAESEIPLGHEASARWYLDQAIAIDSTREDPWNLYLAIAQATEDVALAKTARDRLKRFEKEGLPQVQEQSKHSIFLSKSVAHYTLTDLTGKPLVLGTIKKPMLINFFTFWCGFCMAEFPHLQALKREFPQVQFVFVDIGGEFLISREKGLQKAAFRFLKQEMLLTAGPDITLPLGINAAPRTFIVDGEGIIQCDFLGFGSGTRQALAQGLKQVTNPPH